ncbi:MULTISPECIES: hypothetical protein [unclassified Cupriavidus]|nr:MULTISPECIES: hypothetical protein [unclassified Cupriavidus]
MKRAIALAILLTTTSALLSACIVVPPRGPHYHRDYYGGRY